MNPYTVPIFVITTGDTTGVNLLLILSYDRKKKIMDMKWNVKKYFHQTKSKESTSSTNTKEVTIW